MTNFRINVKADRRGEIVDVKTEGRAIRIVHTLPNCHRGGYIFPNTEKRVNVIDGSVTFYFADPKNPEMNEEHKISAWESITIPKGTAYREFTKEGVYFVAFSYGDNIWQLYNPYRKIINSSSSFQ
jgi:hypothetical protein